MPTFSRLHSTPPAYVALPLIWILTADGGCLHSQALIVNDRSKEITQTLTEKAKEMAKKRVKRLKIQSNVV